jgi:segregation and condensation protein A
MPLEPIAIVPEEAQFRLQLPVFEGPLQLLLHLIESRQLDILTVPLAEVADAYLAHLATAPVDAANLSEFVSIAAQLILLKSRLLLPGEPLPAASDPDEPDEEELRRRLIEYRVLRDAAAALGERDLIAPLHRREPRESDLPEVPVQTLPAQLLAAALDRLGAISEPVAPPPEIVAREITIAEQIDVLHAALSGKGRVLLQAVLAKCRTRTEAAVTFLAALELVRRRQVSAEQGTLFGPITLTVLADPS